ncbi:unnamed protein product [Ascophyllum nodosum]
MAIVALSAAGAALQRSFSFQWTSRGVCWSGRLPRPRCGIALFIPRAGTDSTREYCSTVFVNYTVVNSTKYKPHSLPLSSLFLLLSKAVTHVRLVRLHGQPTDPHPLSCVLYLWPSYFNCVPAIPDADLSFSPTVGNRVPVVLYRHIRLRSFGFCALI